MTALMSNFHMLSGLALGSLSILLVSLFLLFEGGAGFSAAQAQTKISLAFLL